MHFNDFFLPFNIIWLCQRLHQTSYLRIFHNILAIGLIFIAKIKTIKIVAYNKTKKSVTNIPLSMTHSFQESMPLQKQVWVMILQQTNMRGYVSLVEQNYVICMACDYTKVCVNFEKRRVCSRTQFKDRLRGASNPAVH